MSAGRSRAAGLALGFLADQLLGDPRRGHPVAGFGMVAARLERMIWADSRARGATHTAILVGAASTLGVAAERLTRGRSVPSTLVVATATWAVLGGRSLAREASGVARLLEVDDLTGARVQITHLVGRDPSQLGADDIARAAVESVAENTSDAVVAPLLAGALLGTPGLVGYRAINTLDAMVGHRTPRHEQFGWASARLDDVANVLPARLAGLLAAAAAPLVDGTPRAALEAWRRDAAGHPSPNAGVVEASFAGALGITLGGTNVYAGRTEHRVILGSGPQPAIPDVARSVRLATAVDWGAAATCVGLALLSARRRAPAAAGRLAHRH